MTITLDVALVWNLTLNRKNRHNYQSFKNEDLGDKWFWNNWEQYIIIIIIFISGGKILTTACSLEIVQCKRAFKTSVTLVGGRSVLT